jgi:hypothetical protein
MYERERKYTVNVQCCVQYTLFNVGNILMCVIYQLNFTIFMYVTRVSRYITLYIYIYSVRYYPQFHVIAVGLRGSACIYNQKAFNI